MTFGITRLFKRDPHEAQVRALYLKIVEQARRPAFYRNCGVPDSLDGRFELMVLHAFLVLHRLKGAVAAQDFAQSLFDLLFLDMDASLREIGVGDLSVGKQVKTMAQGFYGRAAAYEEGLAAGPEQLAAALGRNLYGTIMPEAAQVAAMAAYLQREAASLAARDTAALMAGELAFGPPPGGRESD